MRLDNDKRLGDDAGASQLGTVTGDVTSGLTALLAVGVDTTTTPTGGQNVGDPTGGYMFVDTLTGVAAGPPSPRGLRWRQVRL